MRYEQVKETVKSVNTQLLSIGMSWKMIDEFWIECLTEVKENINAKNKKEKVQGM